MSSSHQTPQHHHDDMDFTQTSGFEYMNLGDASEAEKKVIYNILFKNPQTVHSQENLFKDLRPHPGEYLSTIVQQSQIHEQQGQNHHGVGISGLGDGHQPIFVPAAPAQVMQLQQQHQQNGPVITAGPQVLMLEQQAARPGTYYHQPGPPPGNLMGHQHQGPIHIPYAAYASQINQAGPPHHHTYIPGHPHGHYMPQFIIPGAVQTGPVPVSSAQQGMNMGGDEGKTHGHRHEQSSGGGQRPRSKGPQGQSPRGSGQRRNDEQQQQQHYAPQGYYPAGNVIYLTGPNPNGAPTSILVQTPHPGVFAPHMYQQQPTIQQQQQLHQSLAVTSTSNTLSTNSGEQLQQHLAPTSSLTYISGVSYEPKAPQLVATTTNGPISPAVQEVEPSDEAIILPAPEQEKPSKIEAEIQVSIPIPEATEESKIDETPAPDAPVMTQLEVQIEPDTSTGSGPNTSSSTENNTPTPKVSASASVSPLQAQQPNPPRKQQESNPDFPVLGALPNGPPSAQVTVGRSWASIAKSNAPPSISSSATNGPSNGVGRAITPDPKSILSTGALGLSGAGESAFTTGPALSEASYQSMDEDPLAYPMGEFLAHYTLNHHSFSLTPRGLSNQGNWCYINATLQSLIACPPMVHLFRDMEKILGRKICKSSPIIMSVYDFVLEFEPITRFSQSNKKRPQDAFFIGASFEPSGIRKVLGLLDGATFKVEGRQEDAEEFLSHLLNGLHDEMTKLIKFYEAKRERRLIGGSGAAKSRSLQSVPASTSTSTTSTSSAPVVPTTNGETSAELIGDASGAASGLSAPSSATTASPNPAEDEEWQVMGPKNKGSMTRKTETSRTPISEMFLGQYSSLLHRGNSTGVTPKTTTLQPFFTLQLDIQDDNIKNVRDALDGLSTKEELNCGSGLNGQDTPMWKQLSLEVLPVILVVHLKRFVYDKTTSKISKLTKRVDFGIDLEIGKDLLSLNCKSKISHSKQRFYKLFAAVYHDGEDAHKGHYIADTFHPSGGSLWGQFGWIRYDDTAVKGIPDGHILCPTPPRVPYLLYYRRVDTLNPPKKTQEREREQRERYGGDRQQNFSSAGPPNSTANTTSTTNDNRQ